MDYIGESCLTAAYHAARAKGKKIGMVKPMYIVYYIVYI